MFNSHYSTNSYETDDGMPDGADVLDHGDGHPLSVKNPLEIHKQLDLIIQDLALRDNGGNASRDRNQKVDGDFSHGSQIKSSIGGVRR